MQIAVITNEALKKELTMSVHPQTGISWLTDINNISGYDVIIDLLFENSPDRRTALSASNAQLIIVNSVEATLSELDAPFVRINGWPTFLKGDRVEASCHDEKKRSMTEEAFSFFNKKIEWLPDIAGFITPRVISMIINEAFISLDEKVSTKENIDIAMKTGTNYPYGPFEWAQVIGLEKIASLLKKLSLTESRYQPSDLLLKEA